MNLNELSLTRLCERAYREAYQAYDEYSEFEHAIPVISGNAEAMILLENKTMVIVVRGTEIDEASDLITVLKGLFTAKHSLGRVHRGFAQHYDKLITPIKMIESIHQPDQIVCAGHSLGGAIATLIAGSFPRGKDVTLFAIGCPRVGKSAFAEAMSERLEGKIFRYEIPTDIVCHLPPSFLGYRHVGEPIEVDVRSSKASLGFAMVALSLLRRAVGVPALIARPFRTALRKLGLSFLSDHSCDSYAEGIEISLSDRAWEGKGPAIRVEIF